MLHRATSDGSTLWKDFLALLPMSQYMSSDVYKVAARSVPRHYGGSSGCSLSCTSEDPRACTLPSSISSDYACSAHQGGHGVSPMISEI